MLISSQLKAKWTVFKVLAFWRNSSKLGHKALLCVQGLMKSPLYTSMCTMLNEITSIQVTQSLYLLKTKHHFYSNIPIIRIALLTNRCTMLSNDNSIYSKLNIGVSSAWSLHGMHPGRLGSLYRNNGTILLARSTDDWRYINLNVFRGTILPP